MHNNLPILNTSQYGFRHPLVYKNIRCNSTRYQNSFYPNSIKLWNGLNNETQACESLSSFKKHITSIIKPPVKSIYKIFNPFGISSIIQLRVGLSPLKSHKRRHNFLDTPAERCICNTGNENTEHFLLKCPLYRTLRGNLITSKALCQFYRKEVLCILQLIFAFTCMVIPFLIMTVTKRLF